MGLGRLIAARICHDVVSPLGAISNGVELLEMSHDTVDNTSEIALISESVMRANARIRYFRIAFGTVGSDQSMSAAEVQSMLEELRVTSRLTVQWDLTDTVPRKVVKLAFLMLLCIESGMPWGGSVRFESAADGWTVSAVSDRQRIETRLWAALENGSIPDAVSPSQVQFPLVVREAQTMGYDLTVHVDDGSITGAVRLRRDAS